MVLAIPAQADKGNSVLQISPSFYPRSGGISPYERDRRFAQHCHIQSFPHSIILELRVNMIKDFLFSYFHINDL